LPPSTPNAASGAEGTQDVAPSTGKAVVVSGPITTPLDQQHLGAALRDFADVRSTAISSIAVAAFQDAVETKAQLRDTIKELENECDSLQSAFHEEREHRLVLDERLRALQQHRLAHQLSLIAGCVIAGTGLPLCIEGRSLWGFGGVLTLIGSVFVAVGL